MRSPLITRIAAAVAVATSGAAMAVPLDIQTYDEADPNQTTLYVAGATAHDPGFEKLFQLDTANGGVCQDGTLQTFRSAPDANGDVLFRLSYCTGNANSGTGNNGKRIAIHKASTGGSGNGVGPLVRATATVPFWDVATLTAGGGFTCTSSVVVPAAAPKAEYTLNTGCTNTTFTSSAARPVEAGISDLEPGALKGAFSPVLTTAELGALSSVQISGVVFGVPVTTQVYKRLQALSFPTSNPCSPNNAAYPGFGTPTQNSDVDKSLACMPSLTTAQIAGLYSGTPSYLNWSGLRAPASAGHPALTNLVTVPMPAGTPALNSAVEICRRSNTSGSQTTTQAYFLRQLAGTDRCIAGGPSFRSINGTIVQSNSTSSAVVQCMNGDNNDSAASTTGSIGVLSLEFQPTATDEYQFVKVDGAPPCLLDVIRSDYDFVGESAFQYRASAVGGLPALVAGSGKRNLADQLRTRIGNPAVVQDLNTSFGAGLPACSGRGNGVLVASGLANPANVPVPPFVVGGGSSSDVETRPVLPKSRSAGTPNACGPWRDQFPTEMSF